MKKIFFGWFIVAATLVFMVYNSTMFAYGFTAFLNPIAATFGWSFAQISLASSLRGLETGALDPFIGWMADRWSARKLIFIGIIILTAGTIIYAKSPNLAVFYVGFLLVGLGSSLSTVMVPMAVVSRWFKRNIGKASGILAAGMALGGMFTPLMVKGIDAYGWQQFTIYIAIGMLIIGLALSLVFRDRPEDHGLLPDGKAPDDVGESDSSDYGMDTKEAVKTRAFWFLGITQMLQISAMQSVAVHQMPYITSIGIERSSVALAITVFSMVGLVARLLYGFLVDIFPKRYVFALSCGVITIGLIQLGLLDGSSFAFVILFAVVYGIGAGGVMPVRPAITREYFGVKNFGAIYGLHGFFITVGTAIATPVTGWVYDTRGTYNPIWFIYAALTTVGMILCLLLPRPPSSGVKAPGGTIV